MKGFGSDNFSGVHPQVLAAIGAVNSDHHVAYGNDPYTAALEQQFKELFGEQTESFLVFLGTAANVLCLQSAMQPWHAVICSDKAHLTEDECNAPEKHLGSKVIALPNDGNGKLTPDIVRPHLKHFGFEHAPQPKVISITQATEYGTVYTPDEIKALAELAHSHDMYLHMDGARIANAAMHLGLSLREITVDCGVDMLSLGGTKNGLMGAEAVLLFRPELATNMKYMRKQAMQLSSKMRFLAVQFQAYFQGDLWKQNAGQANSMAQLLAQGLKKHGIQLTRPVQANAIFALMPVEVTEPLQARYPFYVWDEPTNECRLMCSWDTTQEDVTGFLAALVELLT